MKNSDIYKKYLQKLENLKIPEDKPEETIEKTLHTLWLKACGHSYSVENAIKEVLVALNSDQEKKLASLINQRLSGTPLSYITGRQMFMGIEFLADKSAIIPRKETELLGNMALGYISEIKEEQSEIHVIDVCTGAGNLALTCAYNNDPIVIVFGSDLSAEATELARKNAEHLNLNNNVTFRTGDLLEPFEDEIFFNKIDLMTCNPPYISSRKLDSMPEEIIKHEPELAFNGGPFGIKILSKLVKQGPRFIKPGRYLCFEVGLGQGEGMIKILEKSKKYTDIIHNQDSNGEIRAIGAKVK
jgi:release factor glutamine methyltransferase